MLPPRRFSVGHLSGGAGLARLAHLLGGLLLGTPALAQTAAPLELVAEPKVVLPPGTGTAWDAGSIYGAHVLRHGDRWHLFYAGNRIVDPSAPARHMGLGYASSVDGEVWEKHGEGPVLVHPTHGRASIAAVLVENDAWIVLFGVARLDFYSAGRLYLAVGDGPTGPWTIEEEPVLAPDTDAWHGGIAALDLFRVEDEYRLYFYGRNAATETTGIGVATSTDLLHWTLFDDPGTTESGFEQSDPVLVPGPEGWDGVAITAASVLRTPTGWEAFYVGYDRPITQRAAGDEPLWMGRATSADGLQWTKDPANPLFQTRETIWPLTSVEPVEDGYVLFQDTNGGLGGISRFEVR